MLHPSRVLADGVRHSLFCSLALALSVIAPAAIADGGAACAPPGVQVTTDPAGDESAPAPVNAAYDVAAINIYEPQHVPGQRLLAITMTLAAPGSLPSGSYWWVHLFQGPSDNQADYFVSMRTPEATASNQDPIFEYGTVTSAGFTITGFIEKSSSYDASTGTITYIVQNSVIGDPGNGAVLGPVRGEAGQFGSAAGQPLFTNPEDDTTNGTEGNYTLVADGTCGLLPGPPPQPGFVGIAPRFQVYVPGDNVAAQTQGEFSIGYNPKTGHLMAMSEPTTYRITQPQNESPALPESCDANWENVSPAASDAESLDPILWTDQGSGRTFISNLTAGATALFGYTDDDGATWTQASAAPPNGSSDHQTIATGPYPTGSPVGAIAQAAGFDYAVYYCAQSNVPAFCQRSDDGGASFANGVPIYNGVDSQCSGIHGHAKVSPDGTVYVPNGRGCGANQGGAVSTDAGLSWSEFIVPTATSSGSFDPSIGVANDNTIYYCSVNGDGHPHVAVSKDHGATWANDFDIGASQNIENAVFVEAVAGDGDRAACGFLGTTTSGNYNSLDFTGVWYLYLATTYDGGQTWATVNVTPGDAVQGAGGICNAGISCSSSPNNRNLLDFNEVTRDETGRVFFGYDDGCVSDVCIKYPDRTNDFTANLRVARQSGGRTLLAQYDTTEPALPKNACLAGRRDSHGAHLIWKAPDNGGAAISGYDIFRATSADGPFTQVGSAGPGTTFDDATADKSTSDYFYKIVAQNSVGASDPSNVVDIKLTPDPVPESTCALPGITVITDATGDPTSTLPAHDITSVSIAEPKDMPGKLAITMKVGDLSTLPPQTQWIVMLTTPKKNSRFVAMTTEGGTTAFKAGDVAVVSAVATSLTTYTYTDDLDPASNYNADGTITLIVPETLIDSPNPGDLLTGIEGRVRVVTSGSAESVGRVMDDTEVAGYILVGNDVCADNAIGDLPGAVGGGPTDGGGTPPPVTTPASNQRFGGALGFGLLLPLLGIAALRRRV